MQPYYERENPRTHAIFSIIGAQPTNAGAVLQTPSGVAPKRRRLEMHPDSTPDNVCRCGCGELIPAGRKFVNTHNLRTLVRTPEQNAKIGEAQRKAWMTKRERSPIGATRLDRPGGYRLVKVSHDGPAPKRWRPEHIVIMEAMIGRSLAPSERVHHINVIRTDNAPHNLHLFPNDSQHGQAHASLLRLVDGLLKDGVIVFNRETGQYERS